MDRRIFIRNVLGLAAAGICANEMIAPAAAAPLPVNPTVTGTEGTIETGEYRPESDGPPKVENAQYYYRRRRYRRRVYRRRRRYYRRVYYRPVYRRRVIWF